MTEEEFDAAMRGVLLDTLKFEWSDFLKDALPVEMSKRYRRQTHKLLADPWSWVQKKTRPVWKRVLRTAAAVLLVCAVALGTLANRRRRTCRNTASPPCRKAIRRSSERADRNRFSPALL